MLILFEMLKCVTVPELLALAVVVDFTELGALLLVAAAEAVSESRRLSVISVVSGDVAAMAAFVRLHATSTVERARVAARPLFSTPVLQTQQILQVRVAGKITQCFIINVDFGFTT